MVAESLKGRVLESALIIVQFGGFKKQVGPDLQGMLPRVLGCLSNPELFSHSSARENQGASLVCAEPRCEMKGIT